MDTNQNILDRIVRDLGGSRNGTTTMVKCPCHADKNPSLSVDISNGKLLVKCFAGCSQKAVVDALKSRGLWPSNGHQATESDRPPGIPGRWADKRKGFSGTFTASWEYKDTNGETLGHTARYDDGKDKQVIPFFKKNGNRWKPGTAPEPRPLYGLNLLAENPNKTVLVVEGEKAAEAGRRIFGDKLTVITWQGGANAVYKADWTPLKDRTVFIWPDNDEPGRKAAQDVKRSIQAAGKGL